MNEYVDFQNALALAIASGIGGDGEMMVQDVLWEGNLNNNTDTANLSKSIFDYDLIGVFSSSGVDSSGFNNNQMQKFVIPEKGNTNTYQFSLNCYLPGSQGSTSPYKFQYEYGMRFGFPTEKTLAMDRIYTNGYTAARIFKVIGIKFTGTKSIDYSTEEQVIGKWIDGKPLYRKVFPFDTTVTINGNSYTEVSINISYIDKIIDNTVFATNFSGIRKNVAVQVHSTNKTIFLYNFSSASTTSGGCMIEYTKTTD